MARQKKRPEYYGGKIRPLVEMVSQLVAMDPTLAENMQRLHAVVGANVEGYGREDVCFNCGSSMKIAVYTAGIMEALLVMAMAREVRHTLTKLPAGTPGSFTRANLVHVPTLAVSDATRHAVTRAAYLGLVHQPKEKRGSGYWLVTHWGWKLLRGEEIPRAVKYWDRKLIARSQYTTTLGEMFRTHREQVEAAIARRKKVQADHRAVIDDWNPADWVGYGGNVDGLEL